MTATRVCRLAALMLLVAALGGCAAGRRPPGCAGKAGVTTMLYFGLSRKDGSRIGARAWARFVRRDVVRAFPSGFTVLRGQGYWRPRGKGVTQTEPTRVILRVHAGTADDRRKIAALVARYKRRFGQEAVLRVDHQAGCIQF